MKKLINITFFVFLFFSTQVYSNDNLKKLIEQEIDNEKNYKCEIVTKIDPLNILKKKEKGESNIKKVNFCLKKSDILKLKIPNDFSPPEELKSQIKGCKSKTCFEQLAAKKVFKIFVKNSDKWNAEHPGDMIIGMAWFEIMYSGNLRKMLRLIIQIGY